jgi:hypothetical protein
MLILNYKIMLLILNILIILHVHKCWYLLNWNNDIIYSNMLISMRLD